MADKKSLVNIDFGGASSIKNLPSATPASGDYIVLTDTSDGGKAKKGPSFATNDGKFLRHDGSWIAALPLSGGTMAGHLKWADSSALPSATAAGLTGGLQFILGIKSFADGGDTVYETKANFLNGCVFYTAQTLTDAQKAQARANIGVVQKYRHNIRLYWSGGSGSGYASGTLYFSFKDTTSGSYGASGYTHTFSTLTTFLATHCGMTGNVIKCLPVNGCAVKGDTTAQNLNYNTYNVIAIEYESGSFYCGGTYLWQRRNTTPSGGMGIGYFSEIFPSNASGNYISLEDDVEED